MLFKDILVDFETGGYAPDGVVLDCAAIAFYDDPENMPTFKELVDSAFYVKLDAKQQFKIGRIFDQDVVEWWKKQSEEAKIILKPSESDILYTEGIIQLNKFAQQKGINFKGSQLYSRGNAFDISFYENIIREAYSTRQIYNHCMVSFQQVRCVRTAIENRLMMRNVTHCPLPLGMLDGYIAHNSVHDCAKDILMLIQSKRYALGLEEPPTLENTDPSTLI